MSTEAQLAQIENNLAFVIDTIKSLPKRIRMAASLQQAAAVRTAAEISRNNIRNYLDTLGMLKGLVLPRTLAERVARLIPPVKNANRMLAELPPIPHDLPFAAGAVIRPAGLGAWSPADAVGKTLPAQRSRRQTLPGMGPPHALPPRSRVPGAPVTQPGLQPPRPRGNKEFELLQELDHAAEPPKARREPPPRLPPTCPNPGATKGGAKHDGKFETGWDRALRRSSKPRTALSTSRESQARQRIRAVTASAFAAALDRVVDPNLLKAFAAKHPGGIDLAKLRNAYVDSVNRSFASEFVRLVGAAPPASAGDIVLGAVIAVAVAQTTGRYPIVPPASMTPMVVLVHRALRPQLAGLARMAAMVAAPASAPKPKAAAPARGMTR